MTTSATHKLHHAFKAENDTRIPKEFGAAKASYDTYWDKKPTIAVSRGDDIVYEYRDGASRVDVAVAEYGTTVEVLNERYRLVESDWHNEYAASREAVFKNILENLKRNKPDQVICTGIGTFS